MAKDLAIVLNSGSINSAVTTALAAQKYRVILLHAEITSNASTRARTAYDQQAAHFKPYREHSLPMPFLAPLGNSIGHSISNSNSSGQSRMTSAAVSPSLSPADSRRPAVLGAQLLQLLPLVAAAFRYAVHYQASAVYLGLRVGPHGDDLSQAAEYVQIWNELLDQACKQSDLELQSPLLELDPWQVVDVGFQVAAPFDKTWSCLEEAGDPCWACGGCRHRESAFQQSGKPDPLRAVKKANP